MTVFHGTKHNDTFDKSSDTSSDTFDLYKGGEDTVIAGTGDDVINMGASLDAGDRLNGGDGRDIVTLHGDYSAGLVFDDQTIQNIEVLRLRAGFDYNLTTADGNVASGERLIVNAAQLGAGNHLIFDGSAETDGRFLVYGGAGNDTTTGGAKNDIFHLENGGNDTAHGGGGNDLFVVGNAFTANDIIDGGAGNDTLEVGQSTGSFTATFNANTMQNVETLKIDGSVTLTLNDGNVAAGATLTVDASAASDALTVNGSAETDGSFHFISGSNAANTFSGGGGTDFFDMSLASTVIAFQQGNGGNDTFLFAANFSFNHTALSGGSGSDTLEFNGDYTNLAPLSNDLTSIETLKFLGNHSYTGVAFTGDIADGSTLTIDASAASNISINLSAATSTAYAITGSAGADTFKFGTNFLASDTIDGGAGNDTLALNGGDDIVFGATTLTSVETLLLTSGSFDISTNDGNVASGNTLTVDASALTGTDALTLNASAETNGLFAITGGAGADSVTFGSHYSVSDTFNGGAGNDTLSLTNIQGTYNFTATSFTNVEDLIVTLTDGTSANNFKTTDANVAAGATLTVDFSNSGPIIGTGFAFDGSAELDGHFHFIAPFNTGSGQAIITAGALSDTFLFDHTVGPHPTIFNGLGGDDTVTSVAHTGRLEFNGGSGNDTLALTGGGTVSSSQLFLNSVETITLDDNSWSITMSSSGIASGDTLTVDGTALTGTHTLSFDGSAVTDGSFGLKGGVANDTLIGGGLADNFLGGYGADTLTGNGGADTFFYTAAIESTSTTHDTITDFAAGTDRIFVPMTINTIGALSGTVNSATFDTDLHNLGAIEAQGATVLTVTGGDLNGHTFLVIDGNGDDVYTAGQDYVIDITHYTGTITTGDFI